MKNNESIIVFGDFSYQILISRYGQPDIVTFIMCGPVQCRGNFELKKDSRTP